MMKNYKIFFLSLGVLCFVFCNIAFADFIHPMDFDARTQRNRLIQIIRDRAKKDSCNSIINMCQESNIRMMAQGSWDAFMHLTQAKNRRLMDMVIKNCCGNDVIDVCNYATIWVMYEANLRMDKLPSEWQDLLK